MLFVKIFYCGVLDNYSSSTGLNGGQLHRYIEGYGGHAPNYIMLLSLTSRYLVVVLVIPG